MWWQQGELPEIMMTKPLFLERDASVKDSKYRAQAAGMDCRGEIRRLNSLWSGLHVAYRVLLLA
jgi:uncharacterized protein YukE